MIAVFDNFIKDQSLLDEIKNDELFFSDPGVYKYWKGWWNKDAVNLKQKLAEYIFSENFPLQEAFEIDGFEYWTGLQEAVGNHGDDVVFKDNLEMHYDDDVAYRKENKDYDDDEDDDGAGWSDESEEDYVQSADFKEEVFVNTLGLKHSYIRLVP